jgi:membrane protein implicated in regulation of membrane protease activity
VTKAIGLMLTIAGLILAVWFVQMLAAPGPAPLETFIVAAIAVAMISVGMRYILKSPQKKKPQEGSGT